MATIASGLRLAALATALLLSSAASAQLSQQQPQQRPAAPRPPLAAAPAPLTTNAPRPPASPRAASCHGGASFDKVLADMKQRAASEGVSQRTLAAAAPYL